MARVALASAYALNLLTIPRSHLFRKVSAVFFASKYDVESGKASSQASNRGSRGVRIAELTRRGWEVCGSSAGRLAAMREAKLECIP